MQLSKQTFDFLSDLEANNNREWFQENRARYEQTWAEMKVYVQSIVTGLSSFDKTIKTDISASKCLFRIYRDTRFGLDKTPYKTWLGAGISVNGRKLQGPEYYIHIQPGKSFVATGYWRPEKEHLAAIRQEIDYNGQEFNRIVRELAASKKKITLDQQDSLKRPPQGYSAEHPDIEYLKLKSFTISCALEDAELLQPNSSEFVLKKFEETHDFKKFIHLAIGDE